MADGTDLLDPGDSTEREASAAEASMIRRVRWRLVAWSGGSTLLVLLALGVVLYAAVANTLASASIGQLAARVDPVADALEGRAPDPDDAPSPFGFQFGGGNTFLFAFDDRGNAVQLNRGPVAIIPGLPLAESIVASRSARDGRNVWTGTITAPAAKVPVRILTQRVTYQADGQTYFLQALQDRSTEVGTLNALLIVLVIGGAIVVLVAAGFGWFYAQRALVPIRESLAAQRTSLRRQREFAADASHELRTPLTVIRSSVEYLRRHAEQPVAEVGDALVDIDAEVTNLTSLVEDLLLLARSDSGAIFLERVPIHLDEVATDAASAFGKQAEAAGVRLEVDPEPSPVLGDHARLRQLVTILVDNAIRHSPRGGTVRITVRPGAAGAGDGLGATLAVDDAGPGVAEEHRTRVFDRFWQAPGAPDGGTGLGLAIAKWIAEHHEGTIAVDASDLGGARFTVTLPATPATTEPA
ncbi:MAG TPA: HAMP domain-containing sensor histidine kinase [Candidatus Limnocylindrales bacterium]|nr:HAMP domain-containing sensor histidine kinase [Candidatus Limnocylindrales bacterium]